MRDPAYHLSSAGRSIAPACGAVPICTILCISFDLFVLSLDTSCFQDRLIGFQLALGYRHLCLGIDILKSISSDCLLGKLGCLNLYIFLVAVYG